MDPELMSVLTHTGSALGGASLLGLILKFVLQARKQKQDETARLFEESRQDRATLTVRVDSLEKQVKSVQDEHIDCLKKNAELTGRQINHEQVTLRMHAENKDRFAKQDEMLASIFKAVTAKTG